ncbi:MAG: hypothetical protein PVI57_24030 [Gemmatimonadota bacterium]|jgi:hypothetical protein
MSPQLRNVLIVLAAVAVAFGTGAGWQFTQARQARQALDATRQDLALVQREMALERLEASIAVATVAAQIGDFERGRQLASDFFDLLQAQAGTAPQTARAGLNEILARRDRIITVLSRGQPEAGSELATVLTSLQRALGKEPTLSGPQKSDTTQPAPE